MCSWISRTQRPCTFRRRATALPCNKYARGVTRMNSWNQLLGILDITLGFPNKIRSTVNKKWQAFDQRTGEHVFMLEYRIKVKPGIEPPVKMAASPRDLHAKRPVKPLKPGNPVRPMATIRELMDVRFVHTEDSSPSSQSSKTVKKTTARKAGIPKKTRPNLPSSPIKPA
jgi:hypothetical protein